MIRFRNLSPDVRARIMASGISINPAGNVYYVQSTSANAGNSGKDGKDPTNPFSTLAGLIASGPALVTGDIVILLPGHVEAVASAAAISIAVAGVTVLGIGDGAMRPTFTFGTATTATWTVTTASTVIANIVITNSLDQVVSPLVISAADCQLIDVEIRDASTVLEFVEGVLTTAAADRLTVTRMRYIGQTGGSHSTAAIKLVGCDTGRIDIDAFGKFSTAIVNFITTASTNILVTGRLFNSGTLDCSKNIVDTVTGSTWSAVGLWDAAAGCEGRWGSAINATCQFFNPELGYRVQKTGLALPATTYRGDFTVAGGRVRLTLIEYEVTTIIQAQACSTSIRSAPTAGTAVDLGTAVSLNAAEVGARLSPSGTALVGGAAVLNNAGAAMVPTPSIVVGAGTIGLNTAATNTGAVKADLFYWPLESGAIVS